ncbi:MAG: TRAP transporter small permease [Bacillota bacterium]|nr:TRAP transporter small permease [Bacillota bacterium]
MKKALKWIDDNFEGIIMGSALWAIVLIMGISVIMRYVFHSSLSWSDELSRYIFIWFSFLALSYGINNNTHIRLDLVESFFPKTKKFLLIFGDILFVVFIVYMIKPGIEVINYLINSNQTSAALSIPMYLVYLSFLVGIFFSLVRFIEKYIKKLYRFSQRRAD